jgi:hypothetical protein
MDETNFQSIVEKILPQLNAKFTEITGMNLQFGDGEKLSINHYKSKVQLTGDEACNLNKVFKNVQFIGEIWLNPGIFNESEMIVKIDLSFGLIKENSSKSILQTIFYGFCRFPGYILMEQK